MKNVRKAKRIRPHKIYWSKAQDPDAWVPDMKTYWFPFAEKLMRYRAGRAIIRWYITIRSR